MEEGTVNITLTNQQLEVIYRSLLEMPAKFSLPVIQEIEKQVKEQEAKENVDINKKKV
jgi:hypothetical protein